MLSLEQSMNRLGLLLVYLSPFHVSLWYLTGDYMIRKLDGMEWGYKKRPLRLQWSKVSAQKHDADLRTMMLCCAPFACSKASKKHMTPSFGMMGPEGMCG